MRTKSRPYGCNRAAIAAVLALLLGSLVAAGNATSVSADVSVNIINFAFMPTPLTIPVGTTVVWTNQDTASHTVTSDPGSAFAFDTGNLTKGQSGKVTFNQVGTFTYHCMIHPNMVATVIVTGGAAPAPSAPSAGGPQTFADPAFQTLWAQTDANPAGRSYVWGPAPFTGGLMEEYTGAPGGKRLVQYFDKARMELNAPGGPVTAGLLSVELISGKQQNGDATFVQREPARGHRRGRSG